MTKQKIKIKSLLGSNYSLIVRHKMYSKNVWNTYKIFTIDVDT